MLPVSLAFPAGTVLANDNVSALLEPALAAMDARDFSGAIRTLESVNSRDKLIRFHLAKAQFRGGDLKDALETAESLVEDHPDYPDAWYLKGLIHLARLGEVSVFRLLGEAKNAVGSWEQTVALDPDHIDAHYGILAYYANAPGIAGGDLDRAKSLQGELARMNESYGLLAKGLILSKEKDFEAAEASMLQAADMMDRAGPHFGLAQFYLQQERYRDALEQLATYDAKEKRWWDADITVSHTLKAQAHLALGELEEARRYVDLAMSLNPNPRARDLLDKVKKDL